MYKSLAITLIAAFVALNCVSSLSVPPQQQQAQEQAAQALNQAQQSSNAANLALGNAEKQAQNIASDPKKAGSTSRYLSGGVAGYEQQVLPTYQQQPIAYELPVQSYSAPVQSYGSSYQAPVVSSYQQAPLVSSYSAPVTTSYSAPVQSYSAPVQSYGSSYQAPVVSSYSAPIVSNYSQTSYAPQVSSYSAPVTSSYSTPVVSSYQSAPIVQTYEQPIVQTYQSAPIVSSYSAPIVSNYSTQSYSAPVQSYSAPVQSYSAPVQSYSAPVQSYSAPVTSSYSTPVVSSYSAPIVSNYSTQTSYAPQVSSYSAPVQSYSAPVQSYSAPLTTSYSQPIQSYSAPVQSYSAPLTTSYSAPLVSNYTTSSYVAPVASYVPPVQTSYEVPVVQNYSQTYSAPIEVPTYQSAPVIQTSYQQQSYVAPVAQSYQQQSYVAPVQTYSQQSYSAPILQPTYQQQSYVAPVQTYQQQSYAAPIQTGYQQPSYQGTIVKRQLNSEQTNNSELANTNSSLLLDPQLSGAAYDGAQTGAALSDDIEPSDSIVSTTYVPPAPQTLTTAIAQPAALISSSPVASTTYQRQPQQYLDTQPEFTQSWADFYQPPGFLPTAYRLSLLPYQQQQKGYKSGAIGPQAFGWGYLPNWIGPINPAVFYQQVQLPYYYRVPGPSPYYFLALRSQYNQQIVKPAVVVASTTTYKASTYGKRSLGHDAPYQLLVDHLAAASDSKEIFTNVSSIECPTKPSDYTCPQVLSELNKEELKKKLCDYETFLTGTISLVPDTEKSQTRCGAMKIVKQEAKDEDESVQIADKIAIVLGKDCNQTKSILENAQSKQVIVMAKSTIPKSTKYMVIDGSSVDLLDAQAINKDEITSLLKQCPKKSH